MTPETSLWLACAQEHGRAVLSTSTMYLSNQIKNEGEIKY